MKTYKITINITGQYPADGTKEGNQRFLDSLKEKFVDHLPYRKGECEVRLISISEEEDE